MKKAIWIICIVLAMTGMVTILGSCEFNDCQTCRIIDPDDILTDEGSSCDSDWVERCEDMEDMFSDVTCTC